MGDIQLEEDAMGPHCVEYLATGMWDSLSTMWAKEKVIWSCTLCNESQVTADENLYGKITVGDQCSCKGQASPTLKSVALSVLKEALTLITMSDSTDVMRMQGHLRQSWISLNPSGLLVILLSPHDRRLRGLVNSSWIAIDRKSQQAESLGVRHKTQEIDCTCGELTD